jgi:hypothetical protein
MKAPFYEKKIPDVSIIKDRNFTETNYEDAISIDIPSHTDYTIDYLTTVFFTSFPGWVLGFFKLRNIIVKPFGLASSEKINFKDLDINKTYNNGERAVFFNLLKRSDNELVMADNDKHLNFRTSIMLLPSENEGFTRLYSLTIVKFNNLLGKLYFFPVKPFHILIIKTLLKTTRKNLLKNS